MKKFVICLSLFLASCSSSQVSQINTTLDKYDAAVANFNTAAARINVSIAITSSTLSSYCNDAAAAGQNLTTVVKNNAKAFSALNAVTNGINAYCVSPPQDIGKAVVSMTAIVAAAKAAYQ